MYHRIVITCFLFYVCIVASDFRLHPLSDEFIELINSKQNMWTAGRNFHRKTPLKYIQKLMGTYKDNHLDSLPQRIYTSVRKKYPKEFDARIQWPQCPTLNDIRDQGSCGSCWAVAAVSAMTDRVCILSNGTNNFYFSAEDVLSCCGKRCGNGCNGGVLRKAWEYYNRSGIVSGGSYNSTQGCKPYEIPPCEHDFLGERDKCLDTYVDTPLCMKECNIKYKIKYNKDKRRGRKVHRVKKRNIMKEIYNFGPVTTYFEVFEDFLSYKNGVYKHTTGKLIGLHSVKLIGWGHDRNVKYWIAANSWNTDWGINGFFKIIRNSSGGCGIEDNVVTGI